MPSALSNYTFHLVSNTRADFDAALTIVLTDYKGIAAWSLDREWLVLYWTDAKPGTSKFPVALNGKGAVEFVWHWLTESKLTAPEPDIDGSVDRDGFEISTETRHADNCPARFHADLCKYLPDCHHDFYELFAIRRVWAEHHK